jgi:hypothetical protein
MKIRLLAPDSKMPNIAIMKLSTYHKQKGDDVDWYSHLFDYQDTDILYISKIFDFTPDVIYFPSKAKIVKGGTGYDIKSKLPKDVEEITDLDYSLYPNCDYSMQFYSRGCIRNCGFCVVREKEGYIYPTKPYALNPKGKHIEILDNNFFANPKWRDAIEDLKQTGQPVNFHGVDVRLLDKEQCEALNELKLYKQIHIAWDFPKINLKPKIEEITKYIKPYKLMCYVLIGFNSTQEEDLYRVETLRSLNVDPFVMPFDKSDPYQKNFARWVNHKAIFKSIPWQDYKKAVGG